VIGVASHERCVVFIDVKVYDLQKNMSVV